MASCSAGYGKKKKVFPAKGIPRGAFVSVLRVLPFRTRSWKNNKGKIKRERERKCLYPQPVAAAVAPSE